MEKQTNLPLSLEQKTIDKLNQLKAREESLWQQLKMVAEYQQFTEVEKIYEALKEAKSRIVMLEVLLNFD